MLNKKVTADGDTWLSFHLLTKERRSPCWLEKDAAQVKAEGSWVSGTFAEGVSVGRKFCKQCSLL